MRKKINGTNKGDVILGVRFSKDDLGVWYFDFEALKTMTNSNLASAIKHQLSYGFTKEVVVKDREKICVFDLYSTFDVKEYIYSKEDDTYILSSITFIEMEEFLENAKKFKLLVE